MTDLKEWKGARYLFHFCKTNIKTYSAIVLDSKSRNNEDIDIYADITLVYRNMDITSLKYSIDRNIEPHDLNPEDKKLIKNHFSLGKFGNIMILKIQLLYRMYPKDRNIVGDIDSIISANKHRLIDVFLIKPKNHMGIPNPFLKLYEFYHDTERPKPFEILSAEKFISLIDQIRNIYTTIEQTRNIKSTIIDDTRTEINSLLTELQITNKVKQKTHNNALSRFVLQIVRDLAKDLHNKKILKICKDSPGKRIHTFVYKDKINFCEDNDCKKRFGDRSSVTKIRKTRHSK